MMTGDLLARTIQPVQNALRDAGLSASQLGKVLLVGGSTRMPAVERQVKELLGLRTQSQPEPLTSAWPWVPPCRAVCCRAAASWLVLPVPPHRVWC